MHKPLIGSRLARLSLIALLSSSLLWLPILSRAQAVASDLDPTFGIGGKMLVDFNGWWNRADGLAIQPDGKIIVVGPSWSDGVNLASFTLARLNRDGSLDSTFGTGGKVITSFAPYGSAATAVVLQADGKIVVGGLAAYGFGLARYKTDGTLDSSFGTGGRVITNFPLTYSELNALAIQPNGKIIAGGFNISLSGGDSSYIALARYNVDGSLDQSFGTGGKVTTNFAGGYDAANGVALQPDGRIVVVGGGFEVVRYDSQGNLDFTFGVGGKVSSPFNGADYAQGVIIQSDGKIVVAGETSPIQYDSLDFALARYNQNGSLDTSFGAGGKVVTDFGGSRDRGHAVALQRNGKIIVAGLVGEDFGLARYSSNGTLDSTFGNEGKLITDVAYQDEPRAIAIQPDGKILVAGQSYQTFERGSDYTILRYVGDPPFDLCIQDDSNGNILQLNTTTGEYQFTNCAGLTLGGTGTVTKRGGLITLQHNSTDRRVMATVDTATGKATASIQLLSQGTTFSIMDKSIANNTCACR